MLWHSCRCSLPTWEIQVRFKSRKLGTDKISWSNRSECGKPSHKSFPILAHITWYDMWLKASAHGRLIAIEFTTDMIGLYICIYMLSVILRYQLIAQLGSCHAPSFKDVCTVILFWPIPTLPESSYTSNPRWAMEHLPLSWLSFPCRLLEATEKRFDLLAYPKSGSWVGSRSMVHKWVDSNRALQHVLVYQKNGE